MADRALKINPSLPPGHAATAKIRYDNEKNDEAMASINTAINLTQKVPYHFFLRGEIYMKLRNADAALQDYSRACVGKHYTACQRIDMIRARLAEKKSGDDLYREASLTDQKPKTAAEYIEAGHVAAQAYQPHAAVEALCALQKSILILWNRMQGWLWLIWR